MTYYIFSPMVPMKESQVLLTLTNPVENITHITLSACEEEDPDDINSTAKVFVLSLTFCLVEFMFELHLMEVYLLQRTI